MTIYTIRHVTEQDLPFLREMLYASLYVPVGLEPFNKEIIKMPMLAKYVDGWGRAGDLGYIAVNNEGQSIGSITIRYFSESNQGYGYIHDDIPELGMALVAEYRGKGIGTALLAKIFEQMKSLGIQKYL